MKGRNNICRNSRLHAKYHKAWKPQRVSYSGRPLQKIKPKKIARPPSIEHKLKRCHPEPERSPSRKYEASKGDDSSADSKELNPKSINTSWTVNSGISVVYDPTYWYPPVTGWNHWRYWPFVGYTYQN
jgi:hypothetical protein